MELLRKTSKFQVKDYDDDSRTVKGYGSFFGNLDSDADVIHKGAFNRSIKDWGPDGLDRIKLCAQHNMDRPIAKIIKMDEDEKGLYIEAKFGTHTDGDDYYRMAKEGIVNEFSVGFVAIDKEENEKGGYDINQIKLYEVSMVTVAANEKAVVTDVKSALKLTKNIEDKELAFKLEREILRLMSDVKETATEAALTEKAPEQEVEVKQESITEQLLTLYNK